jgi:hypothetical protein
VGRLGRKVVVGVQAMVVVVPADGRAGVEQRGVEGDGRARRRVAGISLAGSGRFGAVGQGEQIGRPAGGSVRERRRQVREREQIQRRRRRAADRIYGCSESGGAEASSIISRARSCLTPRSIKLPYSRSSWFWSAKMNS